MSGSSRWSGEKRHGGSSGGPLATELDPVRADVWAGQGECGRPAYAVWNRAASRRSKVATHSDAESPMSDGTGLAEALLGLDAFRVLGVNEGADEVVVT